MKSNSDNYPKVISQSAGKTQVAYDIIEVEREDMDGVVRRSFDYTYVNVEGELTRAKIINAIIADTHSLDEEIALINNEISRINTQLASPKTGEYNEYGSLRIKAKTVCDSMETKIQLIVYGALIMGQVQEVIERAKESKQ